MKGILNSDYGKVLVDSDVIAAYTGSVAVGCFGIVGMSGYNMKDGLFHILKKDSLKYGINVKLEENRIFLTIHCIIAYGVSILTVTDNLVESVKYKVEQFTGLSVEKVDVIVEGIRVID
ncbi:MAG: Asp23/Gls24 family envelope stress response protein [Lachnospiraceae bacterium]|nr:Asp23/Gls24 family envelope stress response protein [Lachnospiraceae bacterium]